MLGFFSRRATRLLVPLCALAVGGLFSYDAMAKRSRRGSFPGERGKSKERGKAKKPVQVRFIGAHPRTGKSEDGFCHLEVPHVHPAAPAAKFRAMYRMRAGHYHFVADPAPYQFDGETHVYYGHHPIAVDVVVGAAARFQSGQNLEFCYLDGAHRHLFAPQAGLNFEFKGEANWYIGKMPATYAAAEAEFSAVNKIYADLEFEVPTVVVATPPQGFVGAYAGVTAGANLDVVSDIKGDVEGELDAKATLPTLEFGGEFKAGGGAKIEGGGAAEAKASTKVKAPTLDIKAGAKTSAPNVKAKAKASADGDASGSWRSKRGWK